MLPHTGTNTTYSGNQLSGHSVNFLGNVSGDVKVSPLRDDRQCIRDLRITDPSADMKRIKHNKDELLTECYNWIMADPEFQHWMEGAASKRLWIKGDPGKGKTMMMIGVIHELSRFHETKMASTSIPELPTCAISYYFCESAMQQQNTAVAVLRGLIYMLVKQRIGLLKHVEKEYNTAGAKLFDGHNAIWDLKGILSAILNDPTLPQTYLFIDALDECSSGLEELLHIITDDSLTRRSNVKWLVTSRNLPQIDRVLRANSLRTKISLELNSEHVSKAVSAFIRSKVQQLARAQEYDTATKEIVERELNEKAQGTFLWASLVCKELAEVPLWETEAVLKEIPPGLNSIYDRMMGHLKRNRPATVGLCVDILRSVTLAFRPLRLEELNSTASLPDHSDTAVRDLVARCGSFLTIVQGIVSFVHLSAQDYFTSGGGRKTILGSDKAEGHEKITNRLLDTLSSTLHKNMCGLKPATRYDQVGQQHINESAISRLEYASLYWVEHLALCIDRCPSVLFDNAKVHEFLKQNLLYWMEALLLNQHLFDIDTALSRLRGIVLNVSFDLVMEFGVRRCDVLLSLVDGALRFCERHEFCISFTWPLQLYYSALLLEPEGSMIRSLFAGDIPESMNCKFFHQELGPFGRVVLSPRGDIIALIIGSTILLRDVTTKELLQILQGHTLSVTCTIFSPQGNKIASVSLDRTVRLWDTFTGRLQHTFTGHTSEISCIAFSWLGNRVASGSWDRTVRLWDVMSGRLLWIFEGHTSYVCRIAFSPDNDIVASVSLNGTVRLWDSKYGREIRTLGHAATRRRRAYFRRLAFSLEGDQLVSVNGSDVRLWDTNRGTILQEFDVLKSLHKESPQVCRELVIQDGLFVKAEDAPIISTLPSALPSNILPQGCQWKHFLVYRDKVWLFVDGEAHVCLPCIDLVGTSLSGKVAISTHHRALCIFDFNCT